jgi:hypothetical protein
MHKPGLTKPFRRFTAVAVSFLVLFSPVCLYAQDSLPALRVSSNHRFLESASGKPFFYLADTAWNLFFRLNRQDMDYYLRNRAGKGFTVVQATLLSNENGLTEPTPEGQTPFRNGDPDEPNEKYFESVDFAVTRANEYGLYMAVLPVWGTYVKQDTWKNEIYNTRPIFTKESAYRYGLFLGKRYANHTNVLWVLGGDRSPAGVEDVWEAMAKGLREGDGGRHLITYHPGGQTSSTQYLADKTWLDFNMLQVGHYRFDGMDAQAVQHDYELKPTKPIVNGETTYEDMPCNFTTANPRFNAYDVRKAAYRSVFAGAFGHTYGDNNIWQMYEKGKIPVDGAQTEWGQALDAPGSFQMRHLRALMESRPFFSRIPDQSIILPDAEAAGHDSDRIQVTRDGKAGQKDATFIFVYLPILKKVDIDTRVIPASRLKAWWYDPRTGSSFPLGAFQNEGHFSPHGGRIIRDQLPRDTQGGPDWVLVIDSAEAGYLAPGGG